MKKTIVLSVHPRDHRGQSRPRSSLIGIVPSLVDVGVWFGKLSLVLLERILRNQKLEVRNRKGNVQKERLLSVTPDEVQRPLGDQV
ncbi:MAG: hypothetical protein ACYTE3_27205, partial [Planctomycetota bacterium]